MKEESCEPNISSFIKSLRDIGYTFEIAVADILDNSVSAKSKNIEILSMKDPEIFLSILDDGIGMDEVTLKEAMRISSIDPDNERDSLDLGRFSLGLKTASYSQCTLLTVVSKTNNSNLNARQWDLDKTGRLNKWVLNSLEEEDIKKLFNDIGQKHQLDKLKQQKSGTLVIWQKLDRFESESLSRKLTELNEHLSLVFHRFLDGSHKASKINISINENPLVAFNPFHKSTPKETNELKANGKTVEVKGHILPAFNAKKTSRNEYLRYATSDGYSRSQGCYLYRANRVISYASWWKIVPSQDANQLVRFEIDISNNQDKEWGISVTKAGFGITPPAAIREDLRIQFKNVINIGRGIIVGRRVNNNTQVKLWQMFRSSTKQNNFLVNKKHPLYIALKGAAGNKLSKTIDLYLRLLEAYLPIGDIARVQLNNPIELKESIEKEKIDIKTQTQEYLNQGFTLEEINFLIGSEGFEKNGKDNE